MKFTEICWCCTVQNCLLEFAHFMCFTIQGLWSGRVKSECDGTRAETRFGLPAKRTSPFILMGMSVQSAAGSRGVHISGSNAG